MSRTIRFSFVTASVSANGGSVTASKTLVGIPKDFNIRSLKVAPGVAGGTTKVEVFRDSTFTAGDRIYETDPFSGTLFDPMTVDLGVPAVLPPAADMLNYEDASSVADDGSFHYKITNFDSGAKTFTITLEIEPSANRLVATADVTYANSSAFASLISATRKGTQSIGANNLRVGDSISIRAAGYFSTDATPGTLRIKLQLDANLLLDGTFAPAGGLASVAWEITAEVTVRAIGTPGSFMSQGFFRYLDGLGAPQAAALGGTAAVSANTDADSTLDLQAKWSVAHASSSLVCTNLRISLQPTR